MSDQHAKVLVTVDMVIPRISPSNGGWEIVLIQRNKQPYQGMWALPGGHLTTEDPSPEAAAQRETLEETGLNIPLHSFKQVYTFEDFEDPRGKYLCLLYVLSEPLDPDAKIEAGDDASHIQWYSAENLQELPDLAFNHIRLIRMALHQMFTSYYLNTLGMQKAEACSCEIEVSLGQHCSNTAYWCYNGIAICPKHIQLIAKTEKKELVPNEYNEEIEDEFINFDKKIAAATEYIEGKRRRMIEEQMMDKRIHNDE